MFVFFKNSLTAFFFCIFTLLLTACQQDKHSSTEPNNSTDLLAKLMLLPNNPEVEKWEAPEDLSHLTALLKYSEKNYAQTVSSSLAYETPLTARLSLEEYSKWVAPALKQTLTLRELANGQIQLEGVDVRQVNLFTDPNITPLVNGRIFALGRGYILVMLVAH